MHLDPAVAAALTAFLVALCGLGVAVCANLTQQVRQNKLDINGIGRKVQAHAEALAGGGKGKVTLPLWDQLSDPLPDGTLSAQRADECGEEACAMVIWWVHGVEVSADALRYELRGAIGSALTNAAALVQLLTRNNVMAVQQTPQTGEVEKYLLNVVNAHRLAICLGNWVSPAVPHWVVVTTASANGVTVNDPWGGRRYNIAWPDFKRLYLGSLVDVHSLPDLRDGP
jgi:hypothetical protein